MIKEQFVKIFEDSFKENWDLPAYSDYDSDVSYSYSQLAAEVAKLHLLFDKIGIQKGDKISLIGKNSSTWAISYLATVTHGAIIVPILANFNPNDINHIINHSDSVLIFANNSVWENLDKNNLSKVKGVLSLTNFTCLYQKEGENIQKFTEELTADFNAKYPNGFSKQDVVFPDISNTETAAISYTSGTTGFSKGVVMPGNGLAGNITFAIRAKIINKGERTVSFLPLAHAYGCALDFLTATAVGAEVAFLTQAPTPSILLKALKEVKPTVIFTVPLIMEKIYKNQVIPKINKPIMKLLLKIPSLRNLIYAKIRRKLIEALGGSFHEVIIGGAPLGKEAEDFFREIKFPFTVGYGMTECAPLISYRSHREFAPYSAGRILDIMEVKILSDDPYNEVGEICVRGENLMTGYYKNEEATKIAIDEEGWLHTGDLGTISKEGDIFIRGRNKTMILTASGQNIYPEEIEAKLSNMPFVLECLIIERDNKITALVYPDHEAIENAGIPQEDIQKLMDENLKKLNNLVAKYEAVSKVVLMPTEFEKTPKKSIKRNLYV